ncbi:MAG: MarR family winged helix-turn-helix transcriptional regulator [Alphaproteobacteria bacterium]
MSRIKDFLRLLRELQTIDAEFPLQYAVCLCVIALNEGLSVSALAEETGLSLSTASRIVGALSSARQMGTPYGLVETRISATEKRRKEIFLTDKGRSALENLESVFDMLIAEKKSEHNLKRSIASLT